MTSPYKLASVLLQYPTTALFDGLGVIHAEAARLPRSSAAPLGRFLGWLRATPPAEVAKHYVATFDLRRRCALYLTCYRYGDTRKRGMAVLGFKAAYRAAGLEPVQGDGEAGGELPDYLPLVLDFAALHPRGERLLRAHRADLELLLRGLRVARPPTPTSSRPSARSFPRCAGQIRRWCGDSGTPARPARRSAWSRSSRPSISRVPGDPPCAWDGNPAEPDRTGGLPVTNASAWQVFVWVAVPYGARTSSTAAAWQPALPDQGRVAAAGARSACPTRLRA